MQLTPAQSTTLKNAIAAETDAGFVAARTAGNENAMAAFYNAAASPTFIVWKPRVTVTETGVVFNGTEWAGMSSLNHTRLQTMAQYLPIYNPALPDIRAMFNDIWSGAGGTLTRPAMLALWKRSALRIEKLFATGTGTDALPGVVVFEGEATPQQIRHIVLSNITTWSGTVTSKEVRDGMVHATITYTSTAGAARTEYTWADDLTHVHLAEIIAVRVGSLQRADAALAKL